MLNRSTAITLRLPYDEGENQTGKLNRKYTVLLRLITLHPGRNFLWTILNTEVKSGQHWQRFRIEIRQYSRKQFYLTSSQRASIRRVLSKDCRWTTTRKKWKKEERHDRCISLEAVLHPASGGGYGLCFFTSSVVCCALNCTCSNSVLGTAGAASGGGAAGILKVRNQEDDDG